mmetsp:Transcript_29885/g.59169  ORF Transcript_29885/g.59169 Transcript_29885/m.59169 type:complete len:102 (-) Transcript_29885:30-335(-)
MQGHGDGAGSSNACSCSPTWLCSFAHDVVDPVRIDKRNNTGGSPVGVRAHTTNDESKLHGGSSGLWGKDEPRENKWREYERREDERRALRGRAAGVQAAVG